MRLFLPLIALLLGLNYLLWMTDDRGLRQMRTLEQAVADQKSKNTELADRSKSLEAEVRDLKRQQCRDRGGPRTELSAWCAATKPFYRILDEAWVRRPRR